MTMKLPIFYDKETPKVDSNHTYLAVICLDSALKKDENYYRQWFLKECKYIKQKVVRHIIDDQKTNSEDSHEEKIKAMRLLFSENVFFERVILKMLFQLKSFKKVFGKCIF